MNKTKAIVAAKKCGNIYVGTFFVDKATPAEHTVEGRKNAIINEVLNHYNVDFDFLLIKKRTHAVSFPRQMIMYLLATHMAEELSLKQIGRLFETTERRRYDHSTVIHARKKIEQLHYTDKLYQDREAIEKLLTEKELI